MKQQVGLWDRNVGRKPETKQTATLNSNLFQFMISALFCLHTTSNWIRHTRTVWLAVLFVEKLEKLCVSVNRKEYKSSPAFLNTDAAAELTAVMVHETKVYFCLSGLGRLLWKWNRLQITSYHIENVITKVTISITQSNVAYSIWLFYDNFSKCQDTARIYKGDHFLNLNDDSKCEFSVYISDVRLLFRYVFITKGGYILNVFRVGKVTL